MKTFRMLLKGYFSVALASLRPLTSQKLSLEMSTMEPSQEPDMVLLLLLLPPPPLVPLCELWHK